jgi:hypothetical protein
MERQFLPPPRADQSASLFVQSNSSSMWGNERRAGEGGPRRVVGAKVRGFLDSQPVAVAILKEETRGSKAAAETPRREPSKNLQDQALLLQGHAPLGRVSNPMQL